ELAVAGIAVDLQDPLEAVEMGDRPLGLAVRCIDIDDARRIGAAPWPVVSGIGPELPGLGTPPATVSATIRALSSSLHFRRRPAPVKTSSRRTGSVIALRTVSILSLTVKTKPKTRRSAHHPKGGSKTPLTVHWHFSDFVHLIGDVR